MFPYPDPAQFWRSSAALEKTRSLALAYARREQDKRVRAGTVSSLGNLTLHLGYQHIEFFQDQFPQIIRMLPPGFRAIEVGAGMGWQACMLAAADGTGEVLATDPSWGSRKLLTRFNVSALRRLAERNSILHTVLKFNDREEKLEFDPRIRFAVAAGERLPVRSASFDFAYSVNCVEHMRDPAACFAEAARALKIGGLMYSSTEPLYYSMHGHHLDDYFPLPWGHLLWTADELADLIMKEGGEGREWLPGVPLTRENLLGILRSDLNYASPRDIRGGLLHGPWRVKGWVDLVNPEAANIAHAIGLAKAMRGIPREALMLHGLRFLLQRERRPAGVRLPLRLSWSTRQAFRS